ncbi:MAG: Lrp/AsnC ligand binding domain-containing protein [Acidimicrobiales bacterium]
MTDPLSVGFTVQAMIGVAAEGDLRALGATLEAIDDEIDYVVIASGRFDLLLEVVCEDSDQLLELVNDTIRATPAALRRGLHLPRPGEADLLVGHALTRP